MENEVNEKKSNLEWLGLVIAGVGIVIVILTVFIFFKFDGLSFSGKITEEKVGQFGDFIGGFVGSLFALAGVFLYFVALKEQRQDIKLNQKALEQQIKEFKAQKKELHAQKEEMQETRKVYEEQTNLFREQTESYKKQADEANKQTKTANLDQFNSCFYSFLNIFKEAKLAMTIEEDGESIRKLSKQNSLTEDLQNLTNKYDELYSANRDAYQNYLKCINIMLNIIDSANIDADKREQYAEIFRSQFTSKELLLLYCCDMTNKGRVDRGLFIKYELLKYMNKAEKIHFTENVDFADQLNPYMDRVYMFVLEEVRKYSDIENDGDIHNSFECDVLGIKSNHQLTIEDDKFKYVVMVDKKSFQGCEVFDKASFIDFHCRMLNDMFFCSKSKSIKEDVWKKYVKDQNNSLKFNFSADIEEIA